MEWRFPSNETNNAIADGGIYDNLTQQISTLGTNPPVFSTSGVASASGWTNGANQKYWLIPFSSQGHENITLSLKIGGPATGPRDFTIQYRINENGEWQNVPDGTIIIPGVSTSTNLSIPTLVLPAATFNQPLIFVRILMSSDTAIGSTLQIPTTVQGGGTNRLDEIYIYGTALEEPEEENPDIPLCTGASENITLSEILPAPKKGESEYVELHNAGAECVDLSEWSFQEENFRGEKNAFYFLLPNTIIPGNSYLSFFRNWGLNNSGDALTLFDAEHTERDSVNYAPSLSNYSYSFNGSEWLFSSFQTPGSENIFDEIDEAEEKELDTQYPTGIIINEIFPNPKEDETKNEFVELQNNTDQEQDISDWSIYDASNKVFTFPNSAIIQPKGIITFHRTDFGFALNNTGTDSVTLVNPRGETVSKVEYTGTQENLSYSFDGDTFRWTKKITPGNENEFSKVAKVTITSKRKGYTDVPLQLSASIKDAKKPFRYSWDFGNGRKSTLAEPKHTFTESGKYKASITIRAQDQTVTQEFDIIITKFPHYDILITALQPNPQGKDVGMEWIEIKNFTQKSINLTDWKIASGTDDPVNHPFVKPLVLTPKQVLRLTRSDAAFSLPNSHGIIELRYPNDAIASKAIYQEQAITEDAICQNINERCDFTDALSTEKSDDTQEDDESQEQRDVREVNTDKTLSLEVTGLPVLDRKHELIQNIKRDVNSLLNELLTNTVP